ncbi:MAG TPA: Hpt domain-containing protein, partial [Polyangiaceae bacterium]|nr:Hpt domain-containing protein [Polyangiaceae bacterium]
MDRVAAVESLARCVALGDDVDGALSRLEGQFRGTNEEPDAARLASAVARIYPLLPEHPQLQSSALDPLLESLEQLARKKAVDVARVLDSVALALASLDEAAKPVVDEGNPAAHHEPNWSGKIAEDDLVLLPEFVLEAREQLGSAEQQMLFLEKVPGDSNALNTAFRGLHTVKGVAACLGITPIAELSHELETLLDRARQNVPLDQNRMADVVMRGIDRLRNLVEWLAPVTAGGNPDGEWPKVGDLLEEARGVVSATARIDASQTAAVAALEAVVSKPPAKAPESQVSPSIPGSVKPEPPASVMPNSMMGFSPTVAPTRSFTNSTLDQLTSDLRSPGSPAASSLGHPPQGVGLEGERAAPAPPRPAPGPLPTWAPGANRRSRAPETMMPGNQVAAASTVKVDTRKLDALMDLVGELVVTQSMVAQDPDLASLSSQRLTQSLALLTRTCKELRRVAMSTRMVPIAATFDKMARVLRDVSRALNKPAELVVEGADTELDRNVVETLHDPLLHMIRNSIDHGLETSADRLRLGKPHAGRVTLRAYHEGGQIVVEVSDDGKG